MKCLQTLSLSARIQIFGASLIVVTGLSVGVGLTYLHFTQQYRALLGRGQMLALLVAEACEYPVYTRQEALLEAQLARLRSVPEVAYVVVLDAEGRDLARMKAREDAPIPPDHSAQNRASLWHWWFEQHNTPLYLEVKQPIWGGALSDERALFTDGERQVNHETIGQVRLALSLGHFAEGLRQAVWSAAMVVLAILTIGFSIAAVMTARITAPLKRLSRAARKVTEGLIEPVQIDSGGPDLRRLGHAFNRLVGWIKDYRAEVNSYQAMLERLAYYDDLTGLSNRLQIKEHIRLAVAHSKRHRTTVALLFLDLDRFKYVNDTLGHSAGDRLLQEVAQRLRHLLRASDSIGRMGGDEFVVLLTDLDADAAAARAAAAHVAKQIGAALEQPIPVGGHEINTSFSIGIAFYPQDAEDSETLIRNADAAMYEAKAQGRNTHRFYNPAQPTQSLRRLTLETALHRALELGELAVYYQPKLDCWTARLSGAEALLRWHFQDEWVSPAEFIPLAEETGLILPIGEWVLEEVLHTSVVWRREGIVDEDFHVGVNVAPPQFWHPQFAQRTLDILGRCTPHTFGTLEMELTESCLLRPTDEIQKTFAALREAGVRFAVDDFGTGYSSLGYLKRFPLDVLKIDQSFVRDCTTDSSDAAIVRAIIAVARGLGLEVIAEGVETAEQVFFLRGEGCHLLQGYFIAKPMPVDAFVRFCTQFSWQPHESPSFCPSV